MITVFGKQYKSYTSVLRSLGLKYTAPIVINQKYGSFEAFLCSKLNKPQNPSKADIADIHSTIAAGFTNGASYGVNKPVITAVHKALACFLETPDFDELDPDIKAKLFCLVHSKNFPKDLKGFLKQANS